MSNHAPVQAARRGRRPLVAALALCAATLALSLGATSANAIVATVGGHGYGVTPIAGVNPASIAGAYRAPGSFGASGPAGARGFDEAPEGGKPLIDNGGPVMSTNTTHVVYWDPSGEFTATTKAIIHKFFTDVAHDSGLASNVFGVDGQYGAAYSSSYGGESTDADAYPSSGNCSVPSGGGADAGPPYTTCLYDSQLQTELSAYIEAEKLPTGPTQLYFILLPHKVVTCFGAGECSNNIFCAYHSYIGPAETAGEIVYADIPFTLLDSNNAKSCQYDGNVGIQTPNGDASGEDTNTRFADVALKYISHEFSEAVTDPVTSSGHYAWLDANGLEIGDKCNSVNYGGSNGIGYDADAFLPTLGGSAGSDDLFDQLINADDYYLQSEWDNATSACLMKPALSGADFTDSPGSVFVGTQVSFNGKAVDPYGELSFTWSFGDGATGTGASPTHTYAAPGAYTVTMTPTDGLTGSMTPISHTVTVSEGSGGSSETNSGSTQGTVGAATEGPPPPVISPNSSFTAIGAPTVNTRTGAVTFRLSVSDPGTFSWTLTFQNGEFGAFWARKAPCRTDQVKLKGKCRPAEIVFGSGTEIVALAGTVTVTVKPGASAIKALKTALRRRTGLPVDATLSFQSSRGGSPVSHTQSLDVKLRRVRAARLRRR